MEFVFLQSKISNSYIANTSRCLDTVLAHVLLVCVLTFNPLCPVLNVIMRYFMLTEILSANTAFSYAYGCPILVNQYLFLGG